MPKKQALSKSDHVHKYERVILRKGYTIYRCAYSTCTHYLPRKLTKGKLSICHRCGDEMVMGALQLTLSKPHCMKCVKPREEKVHDRIKELVEAMDSSSLLPEG